MLRTRLRTGVCKTLMPDVVAPEAHQNDRSYVRELSRPTFDFTTQQFSMVGSCTEDLKKRHKTVKIGGWALARDNTVHAQYLCKPFSCILGCITVSWENFGVKIFS